jgi:hypothetical protein
MTVGGNAAYADITDLPPLVRAAIVLDDFIPFDQPGASAHDHARRYRLEHPALQATELRLSPTLATLVGVRLR